MRAAILSVALLAGCAAPMVQTSQAVAPMATSPVPGGDNAARQFAAERADLRRIGYRNCDGFAVEVFAPAQLAAASLAGRSIFVRAYPYQSGGAISLTLPGTATRLQRQTGSGWQDLPMRALAAERTVSGAPAVGAVPLVPVLGQTTDLQPGRYRLWLPQISASRAGASCALSPVWQFDLS